MSKLLGSSLFGTINKPGYYNGRPISCSNIPPNVKMNCSNKGVSVPSKSLIDQYFKNGGRVKKTGMALVHKGEFVLPVGVKPTKAQLKKVAKKRK